MSWRWRLGAILLIVAAACFLFAYESYERAEGLSIAAPVQRWASLGPIPAGKGQVSIDVLDVGQGDAILIRSPEGKTALVDAGPSGQVVKTLRAKGISVIDLMVLSHHHADHYGGMSALIEALPVRLILASTSGSTSPNYLKLLKLVQSRKIAFVTPGLSARRIHLGSVNLTVFPQAPEDEREENNNSIGIRLDFGGFSMLLPGDAQSVERDWWERNVPELAAACNVLKLAHHGSRNGTDARWLELVQPRLAIASLGAGNDYGHPHPETLELLESDRIPLLRTDLVGTVELRSDGTHWQFMTNHLAARAPPRPASRSRAVSSRTSGWSSSRRARDVEPIDPNRASPQELQAIPGIGPVLARRIIDGRPYRQIDDLRRVKGFGAHKLDEVRPYLAISPGVAPVNLNP